MPCSNAGVIWLGRCSSSCASVRPEAGRRSALAAARADCEAVGGSLFEALLDGGAVAAVLAQLVSGVVAIPKLLEGQHIGPTARSGAGTLVVEMHAIGSAKPLE